VIGGFGSQAWQLAAEIRAGSRSAVETIGAALSRIAELDPALNAFTVLDPERALRRAGAVDRGEVTGPLAGVPISVKDHIWLRGLPATNGSRALADFVPDADCVAVERLLVAGAIPIGKTNNSEFCYRGVTENELWGVTRNPHDPRRTAGGSSGGAAVSVSAGMVPLALGTDGGGSIRIPSAFCGTVGLKPSFGLVPKLPGFRGWPTLSVTGPITGSVRDLALALSVLAGPSVLDPLSYPAPSADYLAAVGSPDWRRLRIAVSEDLGFAAVDAEVRSAFRTALGRLSDAGARLATAHPPPTDPVPLWDAVATPEGFASEGRLVLDHPDLIGPDARLLTLAGQPITARQYLDAQQRRAEYTSDWLAFFVDYDVLLTPTMPVTAFEVGRLAPARIEGRPVPDAFDAWCALSAPANLAGLPAASVPIDPGAGRLPIGLQVMAARWAEPLVLTVAAAVETYCSVAFSKHSVPHGDPTH